MLRITESFENRKTLRLCIDGNLTESGYTELESICAHHQESDDLVLVLDMAGVVFMQASIARRLVDLRGERLRLINCSPFIETLLETVTK